MKHLNNYTLHINFDVEKPFIRMYYLVLIWGREIQPCPVLKEADLYKPQPPSLRLLAGSPNGRQRQNRGWEEEKKSRYLPRPAPPATKALIRQPLFVAIPLLDSSNTRGQQTLNPPSQPSLSGPQFLTKLWIFISWFCFFPSCLWPFLPCKNGKGITCLKLHIYYPQRLAFLS